MKTPEGGHKNEERGTGRASGASPIGVQLIGHWGNVNQLTGRKALPDSGVARSDSRRDGRCTAAAQFTVRWGVRVKADDSRAVNAT